MPEAENRFSASLSQYVNREELTPLPDTFAKGISAPLRVFSKEMKTFRDEWMTQVALKTASAE